MCLFNGTREILTSTAPTFFDGGNNNEDRSFWHSKLRKISGQSLCYLRTTLEYYSAVWSPRRIDLVNRLDDVHRRFAKKLNGMANLPCAKRLEILKLAALQTRRIKSDLVLCYSIVHGNSCMKPADFVVLLVLPQDIILNCLSLSVILIGGSIVLLTGLSISGTACRVILWYFYICIGLSRHCNYQLAHYSGFCRISPSILNRFKPNLQA